MRLPDAIVTNAERTAILDRLQAMGVTPAQLAAQFSDLEAGVARRQVALVILRKLRRIGERNS